MRLLAFLDLWANGREARHPHPTQGLAEAGLGPKGVLRIQRQAGEIERVLDAFPHSAHHA